MRGVTALLSRRSFTSSARVFAGDRRPAPKKTSSPLFPLLSFVALAAASFGALSYITKTREEENRTSNREKRKPIPNPLIPAPTTPEEHNERAKFRS